MTDDNEKEEIRVESANDGDGGAPVYDEDGRMVAMLFASHVVTNPAEQDHETQ